MEDISNLIQEAKPLYFARKKRRRQIKAIGTVLGCFLIAQTAFMITNKSDMGQLDGLYTYLYDNASFDKSFAFAITTSDSEIPVDEYGLLAVL